MRNFLKENALVAVLVITLVATLAFGITEAMAAFGSVEGSWSTYSVDLKSRRQKTWQADEIVVSGVSNIIVKEDVSACDAGFMVVVYNDGTVFTTDGRVDDVDITAFATSSANDAGVDLEVSYSVDGGLTVDKTSVQPMSYGNCGDTALTAMDRGEGCTQVTNDHYFYVSVDASAVGTVADAEVTLVCNKHRQR